MFIKTTKKLGIGLSLLATLCLLPATASAATAMCSNEYGTCEVSNDNGDFVFCECEGGDQLGGTGGNEWDGLSEEALHEVCIGELSNCEDIGETTTGGETEGMTTTVGESESTGGETEATTLETESFTTVGEPTQGETEDPTGESDSVTTGGESDSESHTTTTDGESDSSDSGEETGGQSSTGGSGTGEDTAIGETDETGETGETGMAETGETSETSGSSDSDGAPENDSDKAGCSIAVTPGSASLLSLGMLLAVSGIRRRRTTTT